MSETQDNKFVLDLRDRKGRLVRYSRSNFERHLTRHPEMTGHIEAIKKVVEDPDIEIEADNNHTYLYRTGVVEGKFSKLWLFVVIKYEGSSTKGEEFIKTAFFTSKIAKDGRVIWKR